ncbi:MAG: TIGR01777 family oxidoreductase [Bacteroidota bacterium]
MNKKVLITGATGFIAQKIINLLLENGYKINTLSRKRIVDPRINSFIWDIERNQIEEAAIDGVGSIIHLAGENIGAKSWTNEQKEHIVSSRVQSTNILYELLHQKKIMLDCYIGASATGFYGNVNDHIVDEDSPAGHNFLANTCVLWENAHNKLLPFAKKHIIMRIPMVMDAKQGAFPKLILSYPLSLNYFGKGDQYMPWIHIEDICKVVLFFMENTTTTGIYNINAPENSTQKEFIKSLAQLKKPISPVFGIPSIALKIGLGESASLVLDGQRCTSKKLLLAGFQFQYGSVYECLKNILK